RKFKEAGGKLIVVQGWSDPEAIPAAQVDYYEMAEKTMGGRTRTQEFFRLFMVPGMGHCFLGEGASFIDFVGYLESWVEKKQSPDKIIGSHVDDTYVHTYLIPPRDNVLETLQNFLSGVKFPLDPAIPVTFTRPVYPYPLRAKYKGTGDPNDAGSFEAVEP